MLVELYTEAQVADEDLADQVWETWDSGEINDRTALLLWTQVALSTGDCCTWMYRLLELINERTHCLDLARSTG